MGESGLTLGLDIGSAASKCAIMRGGAEIVAYSIVSAGAGTGGPRRAVDSALDTAGATMGAIDRTVATGYGRNSFPGVEATSSELSCHARGAKWLCPNVRTVIDIGGQDCKAISLSPDGRLGSFVMNDKCAAGTGRFLEVMARILDIELSDMGELGSGAEGTVDIASTCTVFAESEVISQLSKGVELPELLAGIHRSVAVRAAGLARRLGEVAEAVFLTGGVSKNSGVLNALGDELGMEVLTDTKAQIAGAVGAALLAYERI